MTREQRKARAFHIMYGKALGATDEQMTQWRQMGSDYINGLRDDFPVTLAEFEATTQRENTMPDEVLAQMANELRSALIRGGADPQHPPDTDQLKPPTEDAFREYQRRGGTATDPDQFMLDLIEEVKK